MVVLLTLAGVPLALLGMLVALLLPLVQWLKTVLK